VIVIATESDLELDQETLTDSPFQYLRRPFVPELFIRALRIALDGPEAVPISEVPVDPLGPVPEVDVDKLRQISSKLMREVGAMSVVLSDRNRKVLTYDRAAGYIDRDVLSAGLGPTFAGTARILTILGDQPRVLKYYDGDKFDIFSLAIGLHHFVSLVFDGASGDRALGPVRRYGSSAVNEMLAIMGSSAFAVAAPVARQPEAYKAPEPRVEAKPHRGRRRTQEMAALKTQSVPLARKAESVPEPIRPPPMPMAAPIVDFDVVACLRRERRGFVETGVLHEHEDAWDIGGLAAKCELGSRQRRAGRHARPAPRRGLDQSRPWLSESHRPGRSQGWRCHHGGS
jgi:hypothetical protein